MNNYPVWWDTTITIYNKFRDAQTNIVTWTKTVKNDCFWKMAGNKVTIGDTILDSKSITCRIPKADNFMEKQDWLKLSATERLDYFTLAPGDVIIKGECSEIIDEYSKGHRMTDLLGKYKDYQACLTIVEYANNTGVGRNEEHYFIRGE